VSIQLKILIAVLLAGLAFKNTSAQQQTTPAVPKKDTVNVGTVTGLVRDSLHNYVMPSTTLAIYKIKDNELVSYQLSNVYGKYIFKAMPVGVPLRLVATHVGYMSGKAEFTISPKTKTIELKTINLDKIDRSLNEVVITAAAAPMQMRGDTLEFNASAFKLDTNAVVEDLLRKLPGVTIWGDGAITVNGKTISRLLVDGKDFFGGDNRIALQNIPKNSIQKVQVYQNKQDPDPITPKTEMNIVLKKNKKDGFFGKFGLGGGTQKHYAADGMITYFSPKTQVAVVGAYNDVNKTAYDVNSLMNFNSFKGEGINNDYHSDFTREGTNTFKGWGFTASHDFSKDNDTRQPYYKTDMLKGEYFNNNNVNEVLRKSTSLITLDTVKINQISNSKSNNNDFGQRGNTNYNKRFLHGSVGGYLNFNNTRNISSSNSNSSSVNQTTLEQTQNSSLQNSASSSRSFNGDFSFSTERYWDNGLQKNKSVNFDFNYRFNLNDIDRNSTNETYIEATDSTKNKYIKRNYITNSNSASHTLTTTLRDFTGLFQRYGRRVFNTDIRNTIAIRDNNDDNDVSDILAGTSTYTKNAGLTNSTHLKVIDERPAITFSKYFYKSLDNRFNINWSISATAENQFFMQRNSALQLKQNLNRSYSYFIPSASLRYYNYQYGDNTKDISLNFNSSVDYPTINQLAPIYDNTNVYNELVGNLGLKPSYNRVLSLNYNYADLATKNPFKWRMNASAGMVSNSFSDSSYYDALGVSGVIGKYTRSTINLGDRKYANLSANFDKTFKVKDHQFQLATSPGTGYNRYLVSVNGAMHETKTQTLNMSAQLFYNYKSTWSAGFGEYFEGNKTDQGALNHSTFYKWTTNFGFAFAFPRSFFFNTRLNYNNTKSSGQANNVYFTIWNADLGYRFLKGSEAEIKISALDILHQNRSIYNSVYNNTITTSTANVLQQYFMLTLAYYPRKFGLKK
jgi:hypothetical protein